MIIRMTTLLVYIHWRSTTPHLAKGFNLHTPLTEGGADKMLSWVKSTKKQMFWGAFFNFKLGYAGVGAEWKFCYNQKNCTQLFVDCLLLSRWYSPPYHLSTCQPRGTEMNSAGIVLDPPLNGSGMNISLICVQMQNIESTKQLCLILSVENWAKTKIFLYTRWSSTDCPFENYFWKSLRYGICDEIFNPAPAPPWPQQHQLHWMLLLPNCPILLIRLPGRWQDPSSWVQTLLNLGDPAWTRPHNGKTAAACGRRECRARGTSLWARDPRILGAAKSCITNPRWRLLVSEDFPAGEIFPSTDNEQSFPSCRLCYHLKCCATGSISQRSMADFL